MTTKFPSNHSKNKHIIQKSPKSTNTPSVNDVYEAVTNKILVDLEKGTLTGYKPWGSKHLTKQVIRPLRWNNIPYTGINTLMLWATSAEKGYVLPHWMTSKQATALKAMVRKGEKGTVVVYTNTIVKEEQNKGKTKRPFSKSYTVFNVAQIDGLPEKFYQVPTLAMTPPQTKQRIEALEHFFAQTKAHIFTGIKSSYHEDADKIQMPPFESFMSANSYYATLAHELTHWTKHSTRLNRDLGCQKHSDEGYAKEELVAELGACFLAADLGIEPIPTERHAAYIQSWLRGLKNDKRFIFSAAADAQKAVEYIHSLQSPVKIAPS